MANLTYKGIASKTQIKRTAMHWKNLFFSAQKTRNTEDEIALLTLLIEKWDAEHTTFDELYPIQLLHG